MQVEIKNLSGEVVGSAELSDAVFGAPVRRDILHRVVTWQLAKRRAGTHKVKSRGEVSGSTAKIYRQKGTGSARKGNRKAPQLRGGGMAFAKKPRDYGWKMPRKARQAALEAAIRGKLEDGEVRVIENFGITKPRTKDFKQLIGRLEIDGSFLVVPAQHQDAVWRSCRNLPGSNYLVVSDLNAYEVLRSKYLLLEDEALKVLEERFGHG